MIHSINSQDHTFSGGWKYDPQTDKYFWSQDIFDALELSYSVVNNGESDIASQILSDSLSLFRKKISEQKPFDIELRVRTRNKDIIFVRVIGTPFFNNGDLIEFFGTYQSIDVVLKKLLQETEEQLKSLTNNIPGLICRRNIDEDFTVVYLSNDLIKLTGTSPTDFIKEYNSLNHLVHPEDIEEMQKSIRKAIEEDRKYTIQYRIITYTDQIIWIEEIGHPIIAEYESDSYFDSILLDITENKKTEIMLNEQINTAAQYSKEISNQNAELERAMEEISNQNKDFSELNKELSAVNENLEESRNFLEKITYLSPNFIYVIDLEEKETIFLNRAAADFKEALPENFDYTANTALTLELVHPEDKEHLTRHFRRQKNLLEGKIAELTVRIKTGDGVYKWVYFRESIFKTNAADKPSQLLGTARDITALKEAEEKLIASEEKLRETQRIARVGRWEYDVLRDEIEFSGEAFRIFGFEELDRAPSPHEYVKNLHEEDQQLFLASQKELIHTKTPYQIHVRFRTPESTYMWVLINAAPVVGDDGKVVRIIGSTQDISDIKLMERKVERLMKTKDAILSMVSHDLKSPLQKIQQLNSFNNTPDDNLVGTKIIDDACSRALTLIHELLEIASLESENIEVLKQETDLCLFIQDIAHEHKPFAKDKGIIIDDELKYSRITCKINRDKFRRVITNIVENSIKFTHEEGTIKIDIDIERDYIVVIVSDTGIGIPPDVLPVIFDKFSSAQRTGIHGEISTGLGLYISKYIMDLHHGKIRVESELNKGTTFYVSIPRYE